MAKDENPEASKSAFLSWAVIGAICVFVTAYGLFLYYVVADKGMPSWDYRIVQDVPAASPYSTANPKQFPGIPPHPLTGGQVERQHVDQPGNQAIVTQQRGDQKP